MVIKKNRPKISLYTYFFNFFSNCKDVLTNFTMNRQFLSEKAKIFIIITINYKIKVFSKEKMRKL